MKRRQYEDRYNVELVDDPETRETSVKERKKDEVGIRGNIGGVNAFPTDFFIFHVY